MAQYTALEKHACAACGAQAEWHPARQALVCSFCGTENETEVDLSAGHHQEFTEDCATCCRPNRLVVEVDHETQEVALEAHAENE